MVRRHVSIEAATKRLESLVGQPVNYGWKTPDMDLYGIYFGEMVSWTEPDEPQKTYTRGKYALHAQCFVQLKRKNEPMKLYHIDSDHLEFQRDIENLSGQIVRRLRIRAPNDLILDLGGVCIMRIIPLEKQKKSGYESWRFFEPAKIEERHLVAEGKFFLN